MINPVQCVELEPAGQLNALRSEHSGNHARGCLSTLATQCIEVI
jgi:hypothetical protein